MLRLIIWLYFLPPTPELVYNECVSVGMQYSEIVTKQFIIETGWGKHYLNNNLFGIYDSRRHKFKEFDSWRGSVKYYKDSIQDKFFQGGDYYTFLECMWTSKKGNCKRYAQDSLYIWKLKHIRLPFIDLLKKKD
jgi:hypothetical protein